jgi:prepilin-type N-terminal cleavage/methylation domain-containing protein
MTITPGRQREGGMSLMELLCVILIISILAAIYLGAISKAFVHIKKILGGL